VSGNTCFPTRETQTKGGSQNRAKRAGNRVGLRQ
jgi:hypothetical protein